MKRGARFCFFHRRRMRFMQTASINTALAVQAAGPAATMAVCPNEKIISEVDFFFHM